MPDWTDRAARKMYEGAGLRPKDVDIFNAYDGYAPRVEGPYPFSSSGGNLENGRTRTAMYTGSIEQLRGTAGARQVRVRAETALAAFTTPSSGAWIMLGKSPS
jgi:hypothetical protein